MSTVTQAEAINWLNSQVGQHLDYDKQYGQQCVDFFNYYYQFVTGDNPYSDGYSVPGAKNLWDVANERLTKIPDSSSLKPERGDVAIYGAAWGAGYGHVEVVLSVDGNGCTFIGENEHGNPTEGVVQVYRTWGQMRGLIGVMRPTWYTAPAAPPFTVVETYTGGKQVRTNKQPTQKWGMNYDNFTAMSNNPVATVDQGTILIAADKVHHNIGYDYYRQANEVDGFNVADCDDYTPPAPMPAPYVPPAAPVPVPLAKKYQVLTNLAYYDTLNDATWHRNSKGSIPAGTYYDFDDNGKLKHLGIDNMKALFWINTEQNVAPVVVPVKVAEKPKPAATTEWKATRVWFYPDSNRTQFDKYELQYDTVIRDLDNKGNDFMVFAARPNSSDNAVLKVYGTVYKDGTRYYLLHLPDDTDWRCWYAIPFLNTHTGKPYLLKYSELYDTTPTPKDYSEADLALEAFAKLGYKVMDVVERLKIKVKKRFNLK
jgi:hypothetical protein